MKYQNGGGEPFEKIKEREKKKKKGWGHGSHGGYHTPSGKLFLFFFLERTRVVRER